MSYRVFVSLSCIVIVAAIWTAVPASAQLATESPPGASFTVPANQEQVDSFGGNYQFTTYHASRFLPMFGHVYWWAPGGYIYPSTIDSFQDVWTQIDLPVGAEIVYLYCYVDDADTTGHIWIYLNGYEARLDSGDGAVQVNFADGGTSISGHDGPQMVWIDVDPDLIVHDYADLNGDGVKRRVAYTLQVNFGSGDSASALKFWGIGVQWRRIISPAPATATFPDVPTGHWAFQYIEALAASGITQGYPDGTFRPTNPVTRAQMATFLARALGLHWPD